MRSGLVVLFTASLILLLPAASASAACSMMDPENRTIPVRTGDYRAFWLFDCQGDPSAGSAGKGTVSFVDSSSIFDASRVVEFRPRSGQTGTDTVVFSADGQRFAIPVSIDARANTAPYCLRWNHPVLGIDERAEVEVNCFDSDGDTPALAAGAAPLGALTAPATTGAFPEPRGVRTFSSTYALAGPVGPEARTVSVGFTVDDGAGPVDADTADAFAVAFPADQPPACGAVSAETPAGAAVRVALSCGDPDPGDGFAISASGGPAHGTLSGVAPDGSVTYTPAAGWSGSDSFTFVASDGRALSAPATVTVVTAGAPGASSDPGPTLTRLSAAVANHWAAYRRYVKLGRLVVRDAPPDATVKVHCAGPGCPFKRKAIARAADGAFRATAYFRKAKLRAGAVVQVSVLAPGRVGKVVRYRIAPPRTPKGRILCLAPGARKPTGC